MKPLRGTDRTHRLPLLLRRLANRPLEIGIPTGRYFFPTNPANHRTRVALTAAKRLPSGVIATPRTGSAFSADDSSFFSSRSQIRIVLSAPPLPRWAVFGWNTTHVTT